MKTNRTQTTAGSFQLIFEGFRRITLPEQTAYLKYLDLLIVRATQKREKCRLLRFKAKLEKVKKVKKVNVKKTLIFASLRH